MNGRLDEMTIYHRALNAAEIKDIADAGADGKCKGLTISTPNIGSVQLSTQFSQTLETVFGVSPYTWSVLNGALPPGVSLSSDGMISGTPTQTGEYTFTVQVTDGSGAIAEKMFTVEVVLVLPPPQIRVSKVGTLAVPGRVVDYFILVENTGANVATNISIGELLDPTQVTLLSVTPQASADMQTLAAAYFIPWIIKSLNPSESTILFYQVRLEPTIPIGVDVLGRACRLKEQLNAYQACYEDASTTVLGCIVCGAECGGCATFCAPPLTLATWPACLLCMGPCVQCMTIGDGGGGCLSDISDVAGCFAEKTGNCGSDKQTSTGPVDPNEKLLVSNARRLNDNTILSFIQPDQLLLYPIHFENIGEVEALDVFVTDVLDPKLDESTLALVTPDGGSFDSATRTVRWDLLGRNLQPGETGNVLLSVKPKPGLPSGTEIHNSATIQFEVFAPLTTPEVISIIDTTPPECSMTPLSSETGDTQFPISWSGTDAIGEIDTYTIYVSANDGTFAPLLTETKDTSAVFTGEADTKYDFFCVAKDTAGNVESQALVAEATVYVYIPDIDGDGVPDTSDNCTSVANSNQHDADGDGYGNMCDGDLNNDGNTNTLDLNLLKLAYRSTAGDANYDVNADLNGDGVINTLDLNIFKGLYRNPPGPSCCGMF
jgi:uncharacterized repeat protein (TIGR01451 family)